MLDRIKRLSYEVLAEHKSRFGEDFTDNKKILNDVSIIRSKGLKNEIAGYITKFMKKEIREENAKKARVLAAAASAEQAASSEPGIQEELAPAGIQTSLVPETEAVSEHAPEPASKDGTAKAESAGAETGQDSVADGSLAQPAPGDTASAESGDANPAPDAASEMQSGQPGTDPKPDPT